jgi:hypothetical protein
VSLPFTLSFGAVGFGFLFAILAFVATKKQIMYVLAVCAIATLSYPLLRIAGLFPTQLLVDLASIIDTNRASSLGFRFHHEGFAIGHAKERLIFGWGSSGRDQPFFPELNSGAVPDSNFIAVFARFGLVGYVALYGLLTIPFLQLFRRRRALPLSHAVLGFALATTIGMLDMLLNNFPSPVLWLMAGGLLGRAEFVQQKEARAAGEKRRAALELKRASRRRQVGLGANAGGLHPAASKRGGHVLARKPR